MTEPVSEDIRKGKNVVDEEEEEESSDSSDSDSSSGEKDPKEIVKKVLDDMNRSKRSTGIEDEEYVPIIIATPNATLENSHSSIDVPLKN